MTKEGEDRDEVFWNTTLAPDDINRLFEPKVLSGCERWDTEAVTAGTAKPVGALTKDDNFLVKGNNLLALHSLKERYAGEIKLIYIDPPYNTGNDAFSYNDRFNHAAWLTFMRSRLEIARDLLRRDGAIFITLDDTEVHYCKVMADEVFGRENFVAHIAWQKRTSPDDRVVLGNGFDNILVYGRTLGTTKRANGTVKTLFEEQANRLPLTEKQRAEYKNLDNDKRGPWVHRDFTAQNKKKNGKVGRQNQLYWISTPSGARFYPDEGYCWKKTEPEYLELKKDGRIWFGVDGSSKPRRKMFLSEQQGIQSWTWWPHSEAGTNEEATKELIALVGSEKASNFTPKPERLLERLIHLATNPGEIILDFFAGSGTTAAVAHKMGRRWVAVEQMDYIKDLTAARLKQVISGEQGGISKSAHWKGGGSFVYFELAEMNAAFVKLISKARTHEELSTIYSNMLATGYLRYDLDFSAFDASNFAELPFKDQKRVLMDCLDANHLYVNLGSLGDKAYPVKEGDAKTTRAFYGLGE